MFELEHRSSQSQPGHLSKVLTKVQRSVTDDDDTSKAQEILLSKLKCHFRGWLNVVVFCYSSVSLVKMNGLFFFSLNDRSESTTTTWWRQQPWWEPWADDVSESETEEWAELIRWVVMWSDRERRSALICNSAGTVACKEIQRTTEWMYAQHQGRGPAEWHQ